MPVTSPVPMATMNVVIGWTYCQIYTVTWNVAEVEPTVNLTQLLRLDTKSLPNAYAVGFQELKAGARDLLARSVYDDPWTEAVTTALSAHNFVRVKAISMVGISLLVFIHRRDLQYVTNVEATSTPTGIGGVWGNKGGVSVRLDISGIDICFVNCHLAAHLPQVQRRIADYDAIVAKQEFSDPNISSILDHDYVFWIGDLNFRIDDIPNDETLKRIKADDLEHLLQYDQLNNLRKEGMLLVDFEEGPIKFNPTYKFDVGTHSYDSSKKQRKPGWCDRILWLVHEDAFEGIDLGVNQLSYTSIPDYTISDHKPVMSEFIIQVLKYPPEMPVMFEPINHWCSSHDGSFSYTANSTLSISAWDWIGLYKANYRHPHDYVTYIWAPPNGEDMQDGSCMFTATLDKSYVEGQAGDFCWAYYSSRKDCLVGYSDVFRISLTEESDSSSSSDDEASEDDHVNMVAKVGTRPKTATTRRRATEA